MPKKSITLTKKPITRAKKPMTPKKKKVKGKWSAKKRPIKVALENQEGKGPPLSPKEELYEILHNYNADNWNKFLDAHLHEYEKIEKLVVPRLSAPMKGSTKQRFCRMYQIMSCKILKHWVPIEMVWMRGLHMWEIFSQVYHCRFFF